MLSEQRLFSYFWRIHKAPFKGIRVFPSKQRNFQFDVASNMSGLRHSSCSVHREVNQKLIGWFISSPCPICCLLHCWKSGLLGVSSGFEKSSASPSSICDSARAILLSRSCWDSSLSVSSMLIIDKAANSMSPPRQERLSTSWNQAIAHFALRNIEPCRDISCRFRMLCSSSNAPFLHPVVYRPDLTRRNRYQSWYQGDVGFAVGILYRTWHLEVRETSYRSACSIHRSHSSICPMYG